jgi:CelD/BcsL family acetyltransferase involved in cellulose biosynthesis
MKIEQTGGIDREAWRGLLARDPNASFFHGPAWIEALTEAYPYYRADWLSATAPDGRLIGALPVIESRRGAVQRLSLPYGTYGTPLADEADAATRNAIRGALLAAWWRMARRWSTARAHLVLFVPPGGEPLPEWPGAAATTPERTQLVDLSVGFDRLWNEVFDGDVRTSCRKAERLGVTIEPAAGAAGLAELARLYQEQAAGWTNHTPFPAALFPALAERAAAGDDGDAPVEAWLARHEGRVVAAQLLLIHRGMVLSWLAPNTPDARRLNAPTLLYRTILEAMCRRGHAWFNFGSSRHAPALEEFKRGLGGRPHDYAVCLREAAWFRPLHRLQYRLRGIRE